jgi:hypothetical protein
MKSRRRIKEKNEKKKRNTKKNTQPKRLVIWV